MFSKVIQVLDVYKLHSIMEFCSLKQTYSTMDVRFGPKVASKWSMEEPSQNILFTTVKRAKVQPGTSSWKTMTRILLQALVVDLQVILAPRSS